MLEQIAARLKSGESVAPVTVRELLRWFGAEYRGVSINNTIRAELLKHNLRITPGLNEQVVDGLVYFHEGVAIDKIDMEFLARKREFHEGQQLDDVEAAMLNKLYVERLSDCLTGWIDRNPGATESEIRAKAKALNELELDEFWKEENGEIIPFPTQTFRIGWPPHLPTPERVESVLEVIFEHRRRSRDQMTVAEERQADLTTQDFTSIGKFMVAFSQIEFLIRFYLSDALNIKDEARFNAVVGPYDFAMLCTVATTIFQQDFPERKAEIENIFKQCRALNDHRLRIAHGFWTYEPTGGLITRHLSRQSLKREPHYQSREVLQQLAETAEQLKIHVLTSFALLGSWARE
jgi:hypothetical protein